MEFKKLSDVEVVETPADTANVLIEENGVVKKAPKTAVGGDKTDMIIQVMSEDTDNEPVVSIISGSYDEVAQKIDNMEPVSILVFFKIAGINLNGVFYPHAIDKQPFNDEDERIVIGIRTDDVYLIIFPDNTIILD